MSDPVTYSAVLPVAEETVLFVSALFAAEQRRRRTRRRRSAASRPNTNSTVDSLTGSTAV